MTKKILTHEEALTLVYREIARLRSSGRKKITVTEVADNSEVGRSTINNKEDSDWKEVREVIVHNKTSERLKVALSEFKEQTRWQLDAAKLKSELVSCQSILDDMTEDVNGMCRKLLEQLHKYMYEAKGATSKLDKNSKLLLEIQDLKRKIELLGAENKNLKAHFVPNNVPLPFVKKNIINVYPADQRANLGNMSLFDFVTDAGYELEGYFISSFPPKVVYILCGNFASGKSNWISNHKPPSQESTVVLYIDGTYHTAAMRNETVKHIRYLIQKHNVNCQIVCVRTLANLEKCIQWNADVKRENTISVDLIKEIDKYFEEVTFEEGFNEIILVRGA